MHRGWSTPRHCWSSVTQGWARRRCSMPSPAAPGAVGCGSCAQPPRTARRPLPSGSSRTSPAAWPTSWRGCPRPMQRSCAHRAGFARGPRAGRRGAAARAGRGGAPSAGSWSSSTTCTGPTPGRWQPCASRWVGSRSSRWPSSAPPGHDPRWTPGCRRGGRSRWVRSTWRRASPC